MLTLDTPWQDFTDAIHAVSAAQNGEDLADACDGIQTCRAWGDISTEDAIARFVTDPGWNSGWSLWIALYMWAQMDADARTALVESIATQDPSTACMTYMWQGELTDEQDAVLRAAYTGKLTYMEEKLDSGAYVRVKDGGTR